MPFVVEDGTGLSNANALASVAFVDGYFADRGVATWTGDPSTKERAIVKATDYVETRWSSLFLGRRSKSTQALSFPREGLYDDRGTSVTGVPTKAQKAIAEYALRALTAALMPDPTADRSGFSVTSYEKTVGPITEKKTFAGGFDAALHPYPAADRLLRDFLAAGGRAVR